MPVRREYLPFDTIGSGTKRRHRCGQSVDPVVGRRDRQRLGSTGSIDQTQARQALLYPIVEAQTDPVGRADGGSGGRGRLQQQRVRSARTGENTQQDGETKPKEPVQRQSSSTRWVESS